MAEQEVFERADGTRYVMGEEVVQSVPKERTIPCEMNIVHKCGGCGFEWPAVLSKDEVKVIDRQCPECRDAG